MIGLGYLVPLDVLLSVWVCFLLEMAAAVAGTAFGLGRGGYPFQGEQGVGAYLAMALFLLYMGRHHLARIARSVLGRDAPDDAGEPLPYRVAAPGALLGFAGLVLYAWYAGVTLWVAVLFFGLVWAAGLTYCRIRCEAGVPSTWALSHSDLKFFPFRMLGSEPFAPAGDPRALSVLTTFFFLVHGGYYNQSTVHQMESFELADKTNAPQRQMVYAGLLAVAIGLPLAFAVFLPTYYEYGSNVLGGGAKTGTGGVRVHFCLQSWQETSSYLAAPLRPQAGWRAAAGVGFLATVLLLLLRSVTLRSLIHPLGFVLANTNGWLIWWPCFVAWAAKTAILKVGGIRLYQRAVPLFLGLALGHYFVGGVVWGTLSVFWPEVDYVIWFS
jgi:hypothetical protein